MRSLRLLVLGAGAAFAAVPARADERADLGATLANGPAFGDPGNVTALPDRVVDGATFSCTYDEVTGWLHACDDELPMIIPLGPPSVAAPLPSGTP